MRLSLLDPARLPPSLDTPLVRRLIQLVQPFRHLIPFALVGASGLLVNSAILAAATNLFGLSYLMGSTALATVGSTLWNFTLTETVVFRDRRRPGWPRRLAMFFIMNNAALLIRGPMIYALTFSLKLHYLLSNLISIGTVTLVRYLFSDKLIWRPAKKPAPAAPPTDARTQQDEDLRGLQDLEGLESLPKEEKDLG